MVATTTRRAQLSRVWNRRILWRSAETWKRLELPKTYPPLGTARSVLARPVRALARRACVAVDFLAAGWVRVGTDAALVDDGASAATGAERPAGSPSRASDGLASTLARANPATSAAATGKISRSSPLRRRGAGCAPCTGAGRISGISAAAPTAGASSREGGKKASHGRSGKAFSAFNRSCGETRTSSGLSGSRSGVSSLGGLWLPSPDGRPATVALPGSGEEDSAPRKTPELS